MAFPCKANHGQEFFLKGKPNQGDKNWLPEHRKAMMGKNKEIFLSHEFGMGDIESA